MGICICINNIVLKLLLSVGYAFINFVDVGGSSVTRNAHAKLKLAIRYY